MGWIYTISTSEVEASKQEVNSRPAKAIYQGIKTIELKK